VFVTWSIVHVLSSFGMGGQERLALDLATIQHQRGHRVSVISLAPAPDGPLAGEFAKAGVHVDRVAKRPGFDLTLPPRLSLAFRQRGADIVHTHNPQPLIYSAAAARLVGAVAIHTKHGVNPGSRGQKWLRRSAARLVSAFVAVSDITAEQARAQRDCPPARLRVIPNGIRLDKFSPDPALRAAVRAELGLGTSWVIGTVGRLDEYKNHLMLIRAMAPHLHADTKIVIVGDGPMRGALAQAVAQLPDPSAVILTGQRMDVPRLLPAFDVFTLPSSTEGLPLVVPEAMAAGLPVVATAVGGLPNVLDHGVTGLLTPVEELPLAEALLSLRDPVRARAMGQAARKDALARFGAERMVDDYEKLYAEATDEAPNDAPARV
jgi:glycosyltransferase involved in cell wall biosynthesis